MNRPFDSKPCEQTRMRVLAKLGGELVPEEEELLDRHVERCARCAREMQELAWIDAQTRRLPDPSVAELAEARMNLQRIIAHEVEHPLSPSLARGPRIGSGLLKAAGFLLFLGILTPISRSWSEMNREIRLPRPDLVEPLLEEVRAVRDRIEPWIPRLSLADWVEDAPRRSSQILEQLPALHFGLPMEAMRSG